VRFCLSLTHGSESRWRRLRQPRLRRSTHMPLIARGFDSRHLHHFALTMFKLRGASTTINTRHRRVLIVCEVVSRVTLVKWDFWYNNFMVYCYILQSLKDKSYYIGSTENLRQRFTQHNQHSARYSSTRAPFRLAWYGAFKTKKLAMDFEKYLKSSSGFAFRNKRLV